MPPLTYAPLCPLHPCLHLPPRPHCNIIMFKWCADCGLSGIHFVSCADLGRSAIYFVWCANVQIVVKKASALYDAQILVKVPSILPAAHACLIATSSICTMRRFWSRSHPFCLLPMPHCNVIHLYDAQIVVKVPVTDLHSVTPSSFLEVSGGTVHALIYQQVSNIIYYRVRRKFGGTVQVLSFQH